MADPNSTPTASSFGNNPASGNTLGTTEPGSSGNSQASGIVDRVRERAAAELTSQKDRAFDGLGTVAQAVRQSTRQLRDQHHETLAGYVEQAADQIDRFAQQIRQKDLGEILDDAQRLARRQPAIFVGSAFAVGLLGARFIKSSTESRSGDFRSGEYGPGEYSGGQRSAVSSPMYGINATQREPHSPSLPDSTVTGGRSTATMGGEMETGGTAGTTRGRSAARNEMGGSAKPRRGTTETERS